jgi:hypothetical protein
LTTPAIIWICFSNPPAQTITITSDSLNPAFWDLKTGLAGELLQKNSNYRTRTIILGDFSGVVSQSLRDFIAESNRTGQVVFCATIQAAEQLLR